MRIVPRRGNSSVVSWLVSEAASLSPCLVAKVVASQRAARPDDIRLPAQEAISGFELRGLAPVEVDVPDLVHPITRGHSFVNEGRGYPNQDAFSFIHVFDKHKARLLYSVLTVWDGHGIDGDMLSHTLRDIFSKEVLAGLAVHAKTWGAGRMEVLQYVFSAALAMTNTRLRSYPQACMWHGGAVFVGIIVDWAARKGVCASLGDGSAFYFREVPVSLKEKLSFRHLGLDSKISFASRALSENMGVENPKYALQVVRRLALANIPGIMRLSDDNVLELIWSVSGFDRVDRTPLDTTPVVLSIDEDFDMRLNLSELAAAMADYTLPVSSRPVFHQFSIHLDSKTNYLFVTSDGFTHKYDRLNAVSTATRDQLLHRIKRDMRSGTVIDLDVDATYWLLELFAAQQEFIDQRDNGAVSSLARDVAIHMSKFERVLNSDMQLSYLLRFLASDSREYNDDMTGLIMVLPPGSQGAETAQPPAEPGSDSKQTSHDMSHDTSGSSELSLPSEITSLPASLPNEPIPHASDQPEMAAEDLIEDREPADPPIDSMS